MKAEDNDFRLKIRKFPLNTASKDKIRAFFAHVVKEMTAAKS